MTKLEKLERLHNRPTRYELVAERGETRILICYSARLERAIIGQICFDHVVNLARLIGQSPESLVIEFLKPVSRGAMVSGWNVRFTGRTQRDAISTESELPFIGDWQKEVAA